MKPVTWGVLGCAKIALTKVIPAMQQSAWCDVQAIASRSDIKARAAADKLGLSKSYGSYEDLLAATAPSFCNWVRDSTPAPTSMAADLGPRLARRASSCSGCETEEGMRLSLYAASL